MVQSVDGKHGVDKYSSRGDKARYGKWIAEPTYAVLDDHTMLLSHGGWVGRSRRAIREAERVRACSFGRGDFCNHVSRAPRLCTYIRRYIHGSDAFRRFPSAAQS